MAGDRGLAPSQENWKLQNRRWSGLARAAVRERRAVEACGAEPQLAAAPHRCQRRGRVVLSISLQNAQLIAGPPGTGTAIGGVKLREILAGAPASLLTGLLPERNPRSAMPVANALDSAHDDEDEHPDRDVGQIPRARCEPPTQAPGIDSAERFRSDDTIEPADRQVEQ